MKKILVVDDESDICLTLANVLEDRFVVYIFEDPLLALENFKLSASKSFKGAGLRLFICRSIVEAHGAKIWAENNIGNGATFHFTLPILHSK